MCFCTRFGGSTTRTYTNHTITASLARCVGCLCTSSGWFKHIEPPRTYTNHTHTVLALCVVVLDSGFVQAHRTTSNLQRTTPLTELARCVGCLSTLHTLFCGCVQVGSNLLSEPVLEPPLELVQKHPTHLASSVMVFKLCDLIEPVLEPHHTQSCKGYFCTRAGWFKHPTHLARVEGVGSCRFAVLEPPRTSAKAPYTPC